MELNFLGCRIFKKIRIFLGLMFIGLSIF
jgi:hypothetical protein